MVRCAGGGGSVSAAGAANRCGEVLELFVVVPADLQPAAAAAAMQAHAGAQRPFEVRDQRRVGVGVARRGAGVGGRRGGGRVQGAGRALRLTHVEALADDAPPESLARGGVGDGEQGARVALADLGAGEAVADGGGQAQQSQGVGDGAAALADARRDARLALAAGGQQPRVGAGLFQGAQVLALHVLDQGRREQLVAGQARDDDGHLAQPRQPGRPPAALAGDQREAAPGAGGDEQRLQDADRAHAGGQFLQRGRVDAAARLLGVGVDLVDGDALRGGLVAAVVRPRDQGVESAPQDRSGGGHAAPPAAATSPPRVESMAPDAGAGCVSGAGAARRSSRARNSRARAR